MNLLSSTSVFSFYTLISRVLGYLRDILIAVFLGASFLADVFFVAFRIPNTFRRLFAEGTFNAAFIPSYTAERTKSKLEGKKFADEVLNLLIFRQFLCLLCWRLSSAQLLKLSLDREKGCVEYQIYVAFSK